MRIELRLSEAGGLLRAPIRRPTIDGYLLPAALEGLLTLVVVGPIAYLLAADEVDAISSKRPR
jgi:hypothetical protein